MQESGLTKHLSERRYEGVQLPDGQQERKALRPQGLPTGSVNVDVVDFPFSAEPLVIVLTWKATSIGRISCG